MTNGDKDPNILDYDSDVITFNWTAVDSGIIGSDMPTRVNILRETAVRNVDHDSFGLEAYDDYEGEFPYIYYIGSVYPHSLTIIQCNPAINEDENSVCQMTYIHPAYNNYILLKFDRKNLADWQEINTIAINYLGKWHKD